MIQQIKHSLDIFEHLIVKDSDIQSLKTDGYFLCTPQVSPSPETAHVRAFARGLSKRFLSVPVFGSAYRLPRSGPELTVAYYVTGNAPGSTALRKPVGASEDRTD